MLSVGGVLILLLPAGLVLRPLGWPLVLLALFAPLMLTGGLLSLASVASQDIPALIQRPAHQQWRTFFERVLQQCRQLLAP